MASEGFEWTSDSNEALDRSLSLILSYYSAVTTIDIEFPVGDTYKFDLNIFNGVDGEPSATIEVSVRVNVLCSMAAKGSNPSCSYLYVAQLGWIAVRYNSHTFDTRQAIAQKNLAGYTPTLLIARYIKIPLLQYHRKSMARMKEQKYIYIIYLLDTWMFRLKTRN